MKESREATRLIQGILIWLMLAFGCGAVWLAAAVVIYFAQIEEIASPYRFVLAAAATVIVGAFVGSTKLFRARRG